MTRQEARQIVFDRALAHLRQQGRKSIDTYGCAYRGRDGRMCAIGPEIVNYDPELEGKAVGYLPRGHLTPEAQAAGADFLARLQCEMHDNLSDFGFLSKLDVAAQRLATECDLAYAEGRP